MISPIEIISISAVNMIKGIAAVRSRRAESNLKRTTGGAGSFTGNFGQPAIGRTGILNEACRETADYLKHSACIYVLFLLSFLHSIGIIYVVNQFGQAHYLKHNVTSHCTSREMRTPMDSTMMEVFEI